MLDRFYCSSIVEETILCTVTVFTVFIQISSWYSLVLHENILQELLSGVKRDSGPTQRDRRVIPPWKHNISTFLRKNPPPDMEELVQLAYLSNVVPDDEFQQAGKQMSQR